MKKLIRLFSELLYGKKETEIRRVEFGLWNIGNAKIKLPKGAKIIYADLYQNEFINIIYSYDLRQSQKVECQFILLEDRNTYAVVVKDEKYIFSYSVKTPNGCIRFHLFYKIMK